MPKVISYTEHTLLECLRSKDQQAFGYLYDNYSKALYTIIFSILPNREMAEEVLQEVFIKIWQNIITYNSSKGRIYTWMMNIARNLAIDRTRSKEFSKQNKTKVLSEYGYDQKADSDFAFKDVGLLKTIDKLPRESRKLLELAYFQGYTQEEISKMLGIPLGSVKRKIRVTIIHLRKQMGTNR